jgi:hypothetical protein
MSKVSDIVSAAPSVVATEMARRKALEAMGIDVYVSRFDLPGAAPAVRQKVESSSPSLVPDHSSETGAPAVETASRHSKTAAPTPVTSAAVRERSEAVRFSMLLASAGPFLWIEQLSDGLIRQDQLALINAMARAISPQASIRQQQFDWPMRGGSAVASDAESAKQALQGLIQRMAREGKCKTRSGYGDVSIFVRPYCSVGGGHSLHPSDAEQRLIKARGLAGTKTPQGH